MPQQNVWYKHIRMFCTCGAYEEPQTQDDAALFVKMHKEHGK